MAVGSSDLRQLPQFRTKHTFLDLAMTAEAPTGMKRSNSAPQLHTPPTSSFGESSSSYPSSEDCQSEGEDWSSTDERLLNQEEMGILSTNRTCARKMKETFLLGPDGSSVRLSELLNIQSEGLTSLGSAAHPTGRCKVCVFENRRIHGGGKPCFKGSLCEFCHEGHSKSTRLKKRGNRGSLRRHLRNTCAPAPGESTVDNRSKAIV